MPSKKSVYNGILNAPIDIKQGLLVSEEEASTKLAAEYDKRVDALFDFFDLDKADPAAWTALALSLAHAHVPGFQLAKPKKQRGPKGPDYLALFADVRAIRRRRGCSEREACHILLRREPYCHQFDKLDTLWRRFMEAKDKGPLPGYLRKLYDMHPDDVVDDWVINAAATPASLGAD